MNESPTMDPQVRAYADEVAAHLADLPDADRAELVDDLEQHLAEIAAESDSPLTVQLGSPGEYAAELRRTAGLPTTAASASLLGAVRRRIAGAAQRPTVRAARRVADDLRPAWWVGRAIVLVLFMAAISEGSSWRADEGWVLAFVVAVAASVQLGRHAPGRADARLLVGFVNAVGVWGLLALGLQLLQYGVPVRYQTVVEQVPLEYLAHPDGEPITNIHAFDSQGRALDGVYLYDGAGRPIEVDAEAGEQFGIETDFQRAADGTLLRNRFPLQQYVVEFDDQGNQVLRVRPAPDVSPPPVAGTGQPAVSPTPTETTAGVEGGEQEPIRP